MVQSPNWEMVEETLFEKGKSIIEQFAQEHSNITCSFFACMADPFSGEFAFCFDTPENAAYEAMKRELSVLGQRQVARERLGRAEAWRYARAYTMSSLPDYAPDVALFQYPLYTRLAFNWREFSESEAYPEQQEGQDSYLEGHTRLIICEVMDRLIKERIFVHLHMTSPFRTGYQFHDEPLNVLRLLNWPAPEGQTIYSVLDFSLAQEKRNVSSAPLNTEQLFGQTKNLRENFANLITFPISHAEITAFPSSLKEQPWAKDIEVFLSASAAAYVQIMWPQLQIDLDGLGRIKVYPTVLEIHPKEAVQPDIYTLTLYDQDQHEFGTISPGSSFEQSSLLFSERICLLNIASGSGSPQQNRAVTIQARLHSFQVLLSLSSRNLWWLEGGEERRQWRENTLEYRDPFILLDDLGTHLERFIAEAGVIGYEEKRRKLAVILFALGRVAQAIGAYPQATQFYGKSAQKFRSSRDIAAAEKALSIVRDLYIRQGMKERAKHVASMLLDLRASQ